MAHDLAHCVVPDGAQRKRSPGVALAQATAGI